MRKDAEHILISANWRDRKLTAREFIGACYRFLNALKDISPAFSNRCTAVGDEFDIVPDDYVSFEEVMTEALADPDSIYTNPDPALDSFTLDSTIRVDLASRSVNQTRKQLSKPPSPLR